MKLLPISYATRNLARSPGRAGLSIGGSMLVVLLVLASAGFVTGMRTSIVASGSARNTILMAAGSVESIERSEVGMQTSGILAASVEGLRRLGGVEAISPEIHIAMPVSRTDPAGGMNTGGSVVFRGVTPAAWLVHEGALLEAGRPPEAGRGEVILGRMAARSLGFDPASTSIGNRLWVGAEPLDVVGIHSGSGSVIEGEAWIDLLDLQVIAQRDSLSCVVLTRDEATPESINDFAVSRLDLELVAIEETDYYATLASFYRPIQWMVVLTAILVAFGGIVGGLNTTYASFASRVRELGTLQTIGYSRPAIMISLVQESLLASAIGALLACVIGLVLIDGIAIRFSMGVFGIRIDTLVVAGALATGLLLGVLGALVPAWRCLRLPIPEALRTSL
ncbi:MAG: FtsX-like permease family protein [Planctomycetota bacterium]|nr:FtsX-like permease family protein [Planctomycetota bacterium]MEC9156494.1 FtsX-like permease family protein [Planctomycetota bacterium]MED5507479.1 FtsX-like permease family protein [Planctomycetota bacterium]